MAETTSKSTYQNSRAESITSSFVSSKILQDNRLSSHKAAQTSPVQCNSTGMPDKLKSGIENISGYSMDDVKVHYNSSKPAQLNAHAYAQGNEIHLGAGQEKHLPHEAWHVVQQKQGRVKANLQMKQGVQVNDDIGLEKEADVMGARILGERTGLNSIDATGQISQSKSSSSPIQHQKFPHIHQPKAPIQRHIHGYPEKAGSKSVSIPIGAKSTSIAKAIVEALRAAYESGKAVAKQPKTGEGGKRDMEAKGTDGYVVGVLITLEGNVLVTISGSLVPNDLEEVIGSVVKGAKFVRQTIPAKQAEEMVSKSLSVDKDEALQEGKVIVSGKNKERGGAAGVCAAPKLMWALINSSRGEKPAEMAEMLFEPRDGHPLIIRDAEHHLQKYDSGQIVPSCITCQHLVPVLVEKLGDVLKSKEQDELRRKAKIKEYINRPKIEQKEKEEEKQARKNEKEVKKLSEQERRFVELADDIKLGLERFVNDNKRKAKKNDVLKRNVSRVNDFIGKITEINEILNELFKAKELGKFVQGFDGSAIAAEIIKKLERMKFDDLPLWIDEDLPM